MSLKQLQQQMEEDDLSLTLIERRKRLAVLATEINQWEDESDKHVAVPPTPPPPPPLLLPQVSISQELIFTRKSGKSPARRSFGQLSPYANNQSKHLDDSGIACKIQKLNTDKSNKENSTLKASPSSAEIINTAHKILGKRETPCSNFKTLKDKFEANSNRSDANNVSIVEEFLTPKLLIKKFEAMSSSKENVHTNTNTKRRAIQFQTPKTFNVTDSKPPSGHKQPHQQVLSSGVVTLRRNSDNANQPVPLPTCVTKKHRRSSLGDTLRDQLYQQQFANDEDDVETNTIDKTLTPTVVREKLQKLKQQKTSLNSNGRDSSEAQFSLTNVTSMNESTHDDEEEDDEDEDEPIYEELNVNAGTSTNDDFLRKQQIIANFKLDVDDFDDVNDTEEIYENTSSMTDLNSHRHNNLESTNRTESLSDLKTFKTDLDSLSSFDTNDATTTQSNRGDNDDDDNTSHTSELYSIKDYRQQSKKHHNTNQNQTESSVTQHTAQVKINTRKSSMLNAFTQSSQVKINASNEKANNSRNERIKELEELIKHEDNIISQTGSALEQCLSDSQFNGSIEHIECNRLLLISCQKRQAYVTEIQRLRLSMTNSSSSSSISTTSSNPDDDLNGTLIFSDIQLPIRESYMTRLKSSQEKRVFWFICLLRYGIQVLQTQVISVQELLSTKDTTITFPNRMAISNVDVNFKVKIDIYAMEMLPKDGKHKRSPTKARDIKEKFFSPFKTSVFSSNHHGHVNDVAHLSNHHHHHQNSTPNNLKSSNFIHIDTIEIMHKDLTRNSFKLNISSSSIPLAGYLHIQVRCMPSKSIELRGFLTMFEDVSGYGSWDRRWCMLSNSTLSYWKYPEDEYKKSPLGSINLIECTNDKVYILSREMCARKHTFELQCMRSNESDAYTDSLISKSYDQFKFTKNWLSADTRENANDWITHINWALSNLRLWNPKAMKPMHRK